MTLTPLPYRAGVVKDDPEYTAKGFAVDSQWVRVVDGYFQSQGGWEKRLTSTFTGTERGNHEWTTSNNERYIGFGTNKKLYVVPGGGWIANITPYRTTGTFAADPIATVVGDTTITITHANHGAQMGATVFIGNATAVGGITLAPYGAMPANPFTTADDSSSVLVSWAAHGLTTGWEIIIAGAAAVGGVTPNGTFLIRVIDANYFQIDVGTLATSNATGGGAGCTYIARRPFEITYLTASTYTIEYPTVATGTATGGGAAVQYLYEINPGRLYGSSGVGWGSSGYSTGGYGASSGNAGASPNDAAVWCIDNYGDDMTANRIGTTIYRWQGNFSARAAVLTNAPATVQWHCVTPNRTVMAFGCTNEASTFDPLLIRFTDSLDPTIWDIDLTNNAGSIRVAQGSRLIAGLVALNTIMCWTDISMSAIAFVGNYEQMYREDLLGVNFGLIGPLAVETLGEMVAWMTTEKSFAYFTGGYPKELPCKSREYVNGRLAAGQDFKIFCYHETGFSSLTWGYATEATQEITDYIRLDFDERDAIGAAGWSIGTFSRTGWIDAHSFSAEIAFGLDNYIYNQNVGNSDNGGVIERWVEWAPIDVEDGNRVVNINKMVYDAIVVTGTLQMELYFKRWPNGTAVTKGPYTISGVEYNSVRGQGRQMGMLVFSETNNDEWRLGVVRADATPGSRR